MAKVKDLMAVDVYTEDLGDYNVTEPGWYAADDGGRVVLGPFDSLAQCEQAIRDRLQTLTKSQIPPTPTQVPAGGERPRAGQRSCGRHDRSSDNT